MTGINVARLQPNRLGKVKSRLIKVPFHGKHGTEVIICVRVVREYLDGQLQAADRLVVLLLILANVAKIVECLRVFRSHLKRPLVFSGSLVDFTHDLIGDAPVEKHLRVFTILGKLECLVVLGLCGVRLAGADQCVALVHQCHDLVWIAQRAIALALQFDGVELRQNIVDRLFTIGTGG